MENRNIILSELQSISPTVAEIVPVNLYEVPSDYFEGLALAMLSLVKGETSAVLLNANHNPYQVPYNYFENLPDQIRLRIKNDEISPVLEHATKNPYEVPRGYFEELSDKILNLAKSQHAVSAREEIESLSPLLSKLDKKVLFSTPEGYFDELTDNVVSGVKAMDLVNEEFENLSPLMNSLKMHNVYAVPAGYFENLSVVILNKAKAMQPAKLVSMSVGKKMLRYAAAAVVTGIVITAGILFMNRQSSAIIPGTLVQAEEKIQMETQNKIKGLSDDEISGFIDNQTSSFQDFLSMASSADIDGDDVKLMLADIPDAELKQYLTEYSDSEDKKVLTN